MAGVAAGRGRVWAVRVYGVEARASDLVRLDPRSGRILGRPTRLPGVTGDIALTRGAVWVMTTSGGRSTLLRLDPKTTRMVARIPLHPGAGRMAAGRDAVWVANPKTGTVSRVDPTSNRVTAVIHVGGDPQRILVGPRAVWVTTEQGGNAAHRIDPATNLITGILHVELEAVAPDALWAIGPWAPNGGLRRVDPVTLRPSGPTLGFDILPGAVAIAGSDLWVGKYFFYCRLHNPEPEGPPIVSFAWFRVDLATMRPLSGRVFVGHNPATPAVDGRTFWIRQDAYHSIIRLDLAAAAQVPPSPTPGLPQPTTATS